MMGHEKGEEKSIKNKRRALDKKKKKGLDILIFLNTDESVMQTS